MTGPGWGMGWMWLFWLLLVLGLVLLVVVAVRAVGGGVSRRSPDEPDAGTGARAGRSRARELLDERYARGDITTEEYRERLSALEEGT